MNKFAKLSEIAFVKLPPDQGMGFWLNVTTPCTLLSVGNLELLTDIPLYTDWNMVGYPARNDNIYTVEDLKISTGADVVEGFDETAVYQTKVLGDTYVLKRGEGYWVHMNTPATWTVNW
jgi:hypothetical protein